MNEISNDGLKHLIKGAEFTARNAYLQSERTYAKTMLKIFLELQEKRSQEKINKDKSESILGLIEENENKDQKIGELERIIYKYERAIYDIFDDKVEELCKTKEFKEMRVNRIKNKWGINK